MITADVYEDLITYTQRWSTKTIQKVRVGIAQLSHHSHLLHPFLETWGSSDQTGTDKYKQIHIILTQRWAHNVY